ncbi:hypothetical protein BX666DRAFT_1902898 [Dichotomocladium elegans]|nr:hypothetical protein BX666DRAFT_1902898 [Dichotomocladium elegans]
MDQQPRIISEQAFGSSKRIQLIGMSPMDTLLNAVNCANSVHLPAPSSHPNFNSRGTSRSMSIESLLDSDYPKNPFEAEKRRWANNELQERSTKIRRVLTLPQQQQQQQPHHHHPMTTMTCLHAAVAQKSYGSEKRFLCPPPIVSIQGESASQPLVSMAVVCENGDRFLEQKILLDDEKCGSFKYLHVTGTAKAKQFHLRVSLSHGCASNSTGSTTMSPPPPSQPYVTFYSRPIAIISKPSKKTSKARNVSSCITANSAVSLFNRINSQTVRTKYMTTERGQLCAKNATWTPFDIIVVRQPSNHTTCMDDLTSSAGAPVNYGSEIVLKDAQTGVKSPPMIIRKVDKGNIAPAACGPVSQMQKIALQLASSTEPVYLSAKASEDNTLTATWLEFGTSKLTADDQEQVDDYLCWTIVGIAKFEYSYIEPTINERTPATTTATISTTAPAPTMHSPRLPMEAIEQSHPIKPAQLSPPPSPPRRIMPLPLIDNVTYQPLSHIIELTGQHVKPFEFWLGSQGPLKFLAAEQRNQVRLSLPPTQDLLVSHHDVLVTRQDGSRYLELSLVLKRQQDGFTFSSGKGLACDILPNGDAGHWSVISMSSSPSS